MDVIVAVLKMRVFPDPILRQRARKVTRFDGKLGKLAADMAVDLEKTAVAAVSLWLGPLLTERTDIVLRHRGEQYDDFMALAETPQFNGQIIHALAMDPNLAEKSGQTLISAELALEYGIADTDGRQPPSYREHLGEPRQPHPARVI